MATLENNNCFAGNGKTESQMTESELNKLHTFNMAIHFHMLSDRIHERTQQAKRKIGIFEYFINRFNRQRHE